MPQPLETDSSRQIEHMWQYATVIELDVERKPPAVKVKFDEGSEGEQVSDWIPFMQLRAGKSFVWMPPQVGEMGVVMSAGGDMEVLKYIGASFADEYIPKDAHKDLFAIGFSNGDFLKHDGKTGVLEIKASLVKVHCDVVAEDISLIKHRHVDVMPGKAKTGKPT